MNEHAVDETGFDEQAVDEQAVDEQVAPARQAVSADGVVTLYLTGEVDEADAVPVSRQIRELLRPPGVHTVVVDLTGITFIDSSGLGLFVSLRRLAEDRGAHFRLRNVPARVTRLLELTGLMGYLAGE